MQEQNQEKKSGFFSFLKPKPKPMSNAELQAEIKIQNNSLIKLNQDINSLANTVNNNFDYFKSVIEEMKQTTGIPAEWQKIISEMKSYNSELPDPKVCYDVLMTYKNLSTFRAEKTKEETLHKLAQIKTDADDKKIHNCAKCEKPLQEGEYYILKGKHYCLSHRGEKKIEKAEKAGGKDAL